MRFLPVVALAVLIPHEAAAQAKPEAIAPPPDAYFEFMLARRLEAKGDSAAALEALKRAQALDPKSAEILAEMAGLYARQNKGAEAIEAAERALKLDPANLEAHRMLGLVFAAWSDGGGPPPGGRSQTQLRELAIEHLTKILETPTAATDLNLQLTLARLHLRVGRADRAVPILENIVSQAPFVTEPYTLLAEARITLGRVDGAIEALEMAAELNPRHFVSLGELYERQSRWEEAAGAYERAIANLRTVPRDLRYRFFAALLNIPAGKGAQKARDALKEFLTTSPQDARGLFMLSAANLRLGDLAGAEDAARKLLALDPASIQGLHALSDTLLARREYRKVVDLLTPFFKDFAVRARGSESEAALLLAVLAHAHSELDEHDTAVRVLTTAIKSDPLSAPALNSLGYALADRGQRLPEAIGFIERALKVDPNNPAYLDSLGWALFKQGRIDEAEPPLRKAADALPTQSVIQDHFGDVLVRLGKFNEAIAAWERALAGDGADIDRTAIEKKIKDARGRQQ
jgi:tetratricopeptide (TPR) repeat protein